MNQNPVGPDPVYNPYTPRFEPIVLPAPSMKDRDYKVLATTSGQYEFQQQFEKYINEGWIPFPESLCASHSANGDCHAVMFWREKR